MHTLPYTDVNMLSSSHSNSPTGLPPDRTLAPCLCVVAQPLHHRLWRCIHCVDVDPNPRSPLAFVVWIYSVLLRRFDAVERHFLVPYTLPLLRDCICNRPCRAERRPRPDRNAAAHTDVLLSVWQVLLGAVLARRVLLLPTTACVPPARVRALRPDAADFA